MKNEKLAAATWTNSTPDNRAKFLRKNGIGYPACAQASKLRYEQLGPILRAAVLCAATARAEQEDK